MLIMMCLIVGAGPAGISATLNAKKHGLKTITLEQDSLGGTVFTFPKKQNCDDLRHGFAPFWQGEAFRNQ